MAKRLYLVQSLRKSAVAGQCLSTVDFTGMADGCGGVMLAFANKRDAKKFARWCPHNPEISTLFETVPTAEKGK